MKPRLKTTALFLACVGMLCISHSHGEDKAPVTLPAIEEGAKLPEGAWPGDPTTDVTYGYDATNPIKVGDPSGSNLPAAERRYLNMLLDREGHPVKYKRLGSGGRDPNGFVSDRYEITLQDGKTVQLWICMYYGHKIPEFQPAPVGFHRRDPAPGKGPQWGVIGDDAALERTFSGSKNVVSGIIEKSRVENVKPPSGEVVHSITVVEVFKGNLKPQDKIEISFKTDSLPEEEDKRKQYIEKTNKANEGSVRFAFLGEGKQGRYDTEWMNVPKHGEAMLHYLQFLSAPPGKDSGKPKY